MSITPITICPVCGSENIHENISSKTFSYKGKSVSFDGFISYDCNNCGESFPDETQLDEIEPKLRDFHREVDGLLTPAEIKSIRKKLGFSQEAFGNVLGGGEKAFARYETGTVTQSKPMDNLLRIIQVNPTALEIIRSRHSKTGTL